MDILLSKRRDKIDRWWLLDRVEPYIKGGIALDIGTGDGSYVYRAARAHKDKFYIGLDSNAENMGGFAQKASKSIIKGGLKNILYVVAAAEALPKELNGLISEVTILFPWGSLLKAVASGHEHFLQNLKRVMVKNATVRIVFSLEDKIEKKVMADLGLSSLNKESLDRLCLAYARLGFAMKWRFIAQDELKSFESTWAKRLAYGRPRRYVELVGKINTPNVIKPNPTD